MNIRDPDELREKVKEAYEVGMSYKEIEAHYGVAKNTISSWRKRYDWKKINTKQQQPKGKVGAPVGNHNRLTHGLYSKYLPNETQEIMQEITITSPLDILWDGILMQYSSIIRSQKIMHVKNKKDMTKEVKKDKHTKNGEFSASEEEFEIQFAWDKQASFLRAQSTAMATLNRMLKEYNEMLHRNWDAATEEQKLRLDKLRLDLERIKGSEGENQVVQIIEDI